MKFQPTLAYLSCVLLGAAPCIAACIEPADEWGRSVVEQPPPAPPPSVDDLDATLAYQCRDAASFVNDARDYTPFPDLASVLPGIPSTWVRCQDTSSSSHAGLQLAADGSWRHFSVEGSELVARSGFEHEGLVIASEYGSADAPGLVNLDFRPFGLDFENLTRGTNKLTTRAYERALVFWNDTGIPVYLPITLPVRDATLDESYLDGERAGSEACASSERGIIATSDEAIASLRGEFVRCSGRLRDEPERLRFDADTVELLESDGSVIRTRSFNHEDGNDGLLRITLPGAGGLDWINWFVVVSRRPHKLWIIQPEDDYIAAVFSAVP